MKVTISAVLRGQVVIEVPESRRKDIESVVLPADLTVFELRSGLNLDTDAFIDSGEMEVEDVVLSARKKPKKRVRKG